MRDSTGDREMLTPIQSIQSSECPVSFLSRADGPVLRQVAITMLEMEVIKDATGLFPGGQDPNKWPMKLVDFITMAAEEKDLVSRTREDMMDTNRRLPG